jgi:hypothetical protein
MMEWGGRGVGGLGGGGCYLRGTAPLMQVCLAVTRGICLSHIYLERHRLCGAAHLQCEQMSWEF